MAADGTGNGDGPEAELMRRIVDSFAAYERLLVGARTKAALAVKKANGKRVGAIPYGYRLAADGETLEPDRTEQDVIGIVKMMRGKGETLRAIADELTAKEYVMRTGGYCTSKPSATSPGAEWVGRSATTPLPSISPRLG